ncbi:MAG: hypothetical protein KIT10_14490 [Flavobacteriales bacterium]|nr:hypothetical protein [Flavobacteriales bacterium]
MSTIIDRLQELIQAYGLNNNSLTVKAGLSVGLIAQSIKNGKGLHSDTIQKILNAYPEVSAEWFVMGRGQMKRTAQHQGLPIAAEPPAPYVTPSEELLNAAREAGRQAAREELNALLERKRTSPVLAGGANSDGAKLKKS